MVFALVVFACASTLIMTMASVCVFRRLGARYESTAENAPYGVSILKPLKGEDDELYENLVAFAHLDYPNYEVVFGAEDAGDPALDVARRVRDEHPHVRIRVLSGVGASVGLNPKVRLLHSLSQYAENDWVLVSDSNVRPRSDYLTDVVACQTATGASLVHNLLAGVGEESLGATFENLQLNSWVVRAVSMADAGGHPCVVGKSMLFRRSVLDELGGFAAVRDILAEDYILGETFDRAGHKVILSPHVLSVVSKERTVETFFNRHVRWGQLRRRISPSTFVGELLLNPTPIWLAVMVFGSGAQDLLAWCGLGSKVAIDAVMAHRLRPETARLSDTLWIPVKDLLTVAMWAVSAVRTTVSWRGHRMRIGAGSRLRPLDSLEAVEA